MMAKIKDKILMCSPTTPLKWCCPFPFILSVALRVATLVLFFLLW